MDTIMSTNGRIRLAILSLLALLVCAGVSHTALAQDPQRGAELFRTLECSECHGSGATGDLGPAIAATTLGIEQVRSQVRSPRGAMMPAFDEEELSPEGLRDIYAWLESLEPPSLASKQTWWSIDLLNLPTPTTPDQGDLEIHFSHRFSESISDAGTEGLFGLDSFAFPGFWFAYGVTDRIGAYVGRTANLATWEFGAKFAVLREDDLGAPVSIGAQVGFTALDADGIPNANRFTAELPVGVRLGDRVAIQAVPFYVTDPDELARPGSEDWSLALGLGGSVRLSRKLSLDGEWITNLDGFERPGSRDQWQAGLSIDVGGHIFQLLATNSVQTTPDFMVGGTLPTGIDSNVRFGFNLVRVFAF